MGDVLEELVGALGAADAALGAEAEADLIALQAALDVVLESLEGAAADEEDVGGVDLEEVLVGMLASALRGHVGDATFDDLQERLLHALAGDVARDAGVVGLARNLVDLVDVDDAALGLLDIEVGSLDEMQEDVLDVLANVAGLGEGGGIGNGEGDIEVAGEGGARGTSCPRRWARKGGCWTSRARRPGRPLRPS